MKVRIYQPTKSAMQSGKANTNHWLVEPEPESKRFIEPLMGWTASGDTTQQLRMRFATKREAIVFAEKNGLEYTVREPKQATLKPKSYSENFK